MNLYLISQEANAEYGTYDSAVVCAASEDDARLIHPAGSPVRRMRPPAWGDHDGEVGWSWADDEWTSPDQVTVQLIGRAADHIKPGTVVCASYNAG